MATELQLELANRGGGRMVMSHKATLTFASGVVGVISGSSVTGGSGGTGGQYPLGFTGGVLAAGGSPAVGVFFVNGSGALTAVQILSPGLYSTAPTAFDLTACPGLTGASATLNSAQVSVVNFTAGVGPMGIPNGSRVLKIRSFTSTALSGSPSAANVTVGTAFGDASYVANTDCKAQGAIDLTLVGAGIANLRNTVGPFAVVGIVAGSTTAAGTIEVDIEFAPPNP